MMEHRGDPQLPIVCNTTTPGRIGTGRCLTSVTED